MAANKPHDVMAPTPLASSSSDSELVLTCLVVIAFLVEFILVWLETHWVFFGEVSVVGLEQSESSEFWSVENFEPLDFLFVTYDLFLGWGPLENLLILFLFPCCD